MSNLKAGGLTTKTVAQKSFIVACVSTNLRRAGVDTVTAMKIVGYKSEKMHRRYNSVSESDLAAAAGKLNSYLSNTVITPATNQSASAFITA